MKVAVSVHGRWHAFELASELFDRGCLSQLLTTYPKAVVTQLSGRHLPVFSKPSLEFRRRIYDRWKIGTKPDAAIAAAFGQFAANKVPESIDVFVGWSSASLEAIKVVQERGGKAVIERGSTHIQHQSEVLKTGSEMLGLTFEQTDPRIVERELAEYEHADAIFVPTKFARDTFVERGVSPAKLIVNPYGVKLAPSNQVEATTPDGPVKILFVGGVGIRKGVPWLLEAARQLDRLAEFRLAGPVEPILAEKLGSDLPDNVTLLGAVSSTEVSRELASADIFCLPSLEEGFPLSLLEAMAAGCACVVTGAASGGVIEHRINGIVVPAMESAALGEALGQLAGDPVQIKKLGDAAKSTVQNGYTWKDYGDRAVAAYEVLLS